MSNFNQDPYQNSYQTAPNSYQNTTSNYYPPMQPPTPPKKTSWFKRQRKRTKAGIGCLALIGVLALCGLCTSAFPTANKANQTTQASTPRVAATATPHATPTSKPKATPTPKPKPTSTPTHSAVVQTQQQPAQQPAATQPPVQQPTQKPAPPAPAPTTPPAPVGVNGNPWGYNFNAGNVIYNPAAGFCSYFSCVSTFWKDTNGYVEECVNGEYSHSGGVSGACSRDGGELRPLYQH
ncbi:hypothetical protein ccbrp13_21310 [Ktedonobacteria bacterium brp13]|nr:hypothetical protein ccbrp13_21310 [Ktedonobacteria bacterium brp13]